MKMCRQIGNSKTRGTWVVRVRYYEDQGNVGSEGQIL